MYSIFIDINKFLLYDVMLLFLCCIRVTLLFESQKCMKKTQPLPN